MWSFPLAALAGFGVILYKVARYTRVKSRHLQEVSPPSHVNTAGTTTPIRFALCQSPALESPRNPTNRTADALPPSRNDTFVCTAMIRG